MALCKPCTWEHASCAQMHELPQNVFMITYILYPSYFCEI